MAMLALALAVKVGDNAGQQCLSDHSTIKRAETNDAPETAAPPSDTPGNAERHRHHRRHAARDLRRRRCSVASIGKLLHFPLPWMTGALMITAALCLAGVPLRSLWQARAAGQFVTGAAVGTTFTPAILVMMLTLLPAILVGAVASIAIAVVGALILMRIVPRSTPRPRRWPPCPAA